MHRRLPLLLSLCIVVSCHNPTPVLKSLGEFQLPLQTFTINAGRDTVIKTANGSILTIPAGALSTKTGGLARLQVREAFTISDMIMAGLTTRSGDKALSSGGMIYFKPDSNTSIVSGQGIAVAIPTPFIQKGMQVYKGQRKEDGTMDWVEPGPLDTLPKPIRYAQGKSLFRDNCATCHNPTKDATGPALAFMEQRRGWKWLVDFTHNPSGMIASGDAYANAIFCKWKPTVMTAFPMLSEQELRDIYDYLDEEARTHSYGNVPDDKPSLDSCAIYMAQVKGLIRERDRLIREQAEELALQRAKERAAQGSHPYTGPTDIVGPTATSEVYYTFTVRTEGWYNIDAETDILPLWQSTSLRVHISGSHSSSLSLYLALPGDRVLLNGGPIPDKDSTYAFFRDNGSIFLPMGKQAYIIAIEEAGDAIYFTLDPFTTAPDMERSITLQPSSQEAMNRTIRNLGMAGFTMEASGSKNADTIRRIDVRIKAAAGLKPKLYFDCDCSPTDTASEK